MAGLTLAKAAGEGILEGLGTKYVWMAFQLPGYGIGVISGIKGPNGNIIGIGADDVLLYAVGAGIAIYGWRKGESEYIAQGLGFAGGVALEKIFEYLNFGQVRSIQYSGTLGPVTYRTYSVTR
jgi:hypothetical protein